jgi:ABC-type branched-subunit amino acid transport system substrate-binding protein
MLAGCSSAKDDSGSSGKSDDGIASARGVDVDSKTISVGIIAPLTGPIAPLTTPAVAGETAFWQGLNDRGGIDGWKVKTVVKDNAFDPQKAKVAYQGMHDDIAMLGQMFLGSTFTDTAADDMVMASGQDISLTQLTNNILVVPPLRFEAQDIVKFWSDEGAAPGAKMATAYFDIQLGQDASTGFGLATDSMGYDNVADVPFSNDTTDFTSVVQQLKDSGAEYVFLGGSFAQNQSILTKAEQLDFHPTWGLSGLAGFNASMVGTVPDDQLAKTFVTQALALSTDDVPGMAQLLADAKKFEADSPVDTNFVLGYATAAIEAKLLEKSLNSGSLSPDSILKALSDLSDVDTGGLLPALSYGSTPAERIPSRATNVYAVDPDSASKLTRVASDVLADSATTDPLN